MRTLETALIDALKLVPKRHRILPVCNSLHISPDGFRASDAGTFYHVPATVPINGSVCLYPDALKLGKGEILESIDVLSPTTAILKTNFRTATLTGFDAEDFPHIPHPVEAKEYAITPGIVDAVKACEPFADHTRDPWKGEQFRGVFWGICCDRHTIAATDAHVLKTFNIGDVPTPDSLVIPLRILKKWDIGHLQVWPGWVRMETDSLNVTWKAVDERFPDVWKVIPAENPNSLQVFTADLRRAVDSVKHSANKVSKAVRLFLSSDGCKVVARDIHHENEATAQLPGVYEGEPLEIAFNYDNLLLPCTMQAVKLSFSTNARACVIDTFDGSSTLVMPIMLDKC